MSRRAGRQVTGGDAAPTALPGVHSGLADSLSELMSSPESHPRREMPGTEYTVCPRAVSQRSRAENTADRALGASIPGPLRSLASSRHSRATGNGTR
ncbi:hypothetical protein AAFF_G00385830 [Aldrovandia affinis]|uniref:Uncharacterized protein n=1 Tax=Aldrovandia affinis TaxID=143900 RepID=A0AAD7WLJ9_9TELE|nr:hypothetical protein AAFF_G00385830 [Aldrovandia affinis]